MLCLDTEFSLTFCSPPPFFLCVAENDTQGRDRPALAAEGRSNDKHSPGCRYY